jgi:hypothetical protein
MATVINLNRFRKAKKRAVAEERAAQNRAASGRTKKERKTTTRERERADRELDTSASTNCRGRARRCRRRGSPRRSRQK